MPTKILTFDIAIKTGWCFGEIGGKLIGGTRKHAPSGADHSVLFSKAMVWIADQINVLRPDRVAVEFNQNTMVGKQRKGQTNIDTIMVHCGLRALMLAVCHEMGVQCRIIPYTQAGPAFFGGAKNKLPGDDSKEPVKRECRIRGIPFVDDNHSDAIALWHHQAFSIDPDFAARDKVNRMLMRDPFFSGAA